MTLNVRQTKDNCHVSGSGLWNEPGKCLLLEPPMIPFSCKAVLKRKHEQIAAHWIIAVPALTHVRMRHDALSRQRSHHPPLPSVGYSPKSLAKSMRRAILVLLRQSTRHVRLPRRTSSMIQSSVSA